MRHDASLVYISRPFCGGRLSNDLMLLMFAEFLINLSCPGSNDRSCPMDTDRPTLAEAI